MSEPEVIEREFELWYVVLDGREQERYFTSKDEARTEYQWLVDAGHMTLAKRVQYRRWVSYARETSYPPED